MIDNAIPTENEDSPHKQSGFTNSSISAGTILSEKAILEELITMVEKLSETLQVLNANRITMGEWKAVKQRQHSTSINKLCNRAERLICLARML